MTGTPVAEGTGQLSQFGSVRPSLESLRRWSVRGGFAAAAFEALQRAVEARALATWLCSLYSSVLLCSSVLWQAPHPLERPAARPCLFEDSSVKRETSGVPYGKHCRCTGTVFAVQLGRKLHPSPTRSAWSPSMRLPFTSKLQVCWACWAY